MSGLHKSHGHHGNVDLGTWLGWLTDAFPSKLPGCTNVILYYGSSCYDTKQMSRLIDLVVEDCKEQGIDTATPAEIALLKEEWGK